jgi:cell division protease FtsH
MGREVSEELAAVVDGETRRIIDECYEVARETLERERPRLAALAEALLRKESLDEREIREVAGLPPKAPPDRTDSTPVPPAEAPADGRAEARADASALAASASADGDQAAPPPNGVHPEAQPAEQAAGRASGPPR